MRPSKREQEAIAYLEHKYDEINWANRLEIMDMYWALEIVPRSGYMMFVDYLYNFKQSGESCDCETPQHERMSMGTNNESFRDLNNGHANGGNFASSGILLKHYGSQPGQIPLIWDHWRKPCP